MTQYCYSPDWQCNTQKGQAGKVRPRYWWCHGCREHGSQSDLMTRLIVVQHNLIAEEVILFLVLSNTFVLEIDNKILKIFRYNVLIRLNVAQAKNKHVDLKNAFSNIWCHFYTSFVQIPDGDCTLTVTVMSAISYVYNMAIHVVI